MESEDSRTDAVEAIRALIETILLEPDGDQLKITLKGDLAGMLSAAGDSKRSPGTGDLLVQIKLVAGARNHLNLEFSGPRRGSNPHGHTAHRGVTVSPTYLTLATAPIYDRDRR